MASETNYSPRDVLSIVEHEISKLANFNKVKVMLDSYMFGRMDEDKIEKAVVIIMTELRKELEKIREKLPEDAVEASALITKKARRAKKIDVDPIELTEGKREVVGKVDGMIMKKVVKDKK